MMKPRLTHEIQRILKNSLMAVVVLVSTAFVGYMIFEVHSANRQIENLLLDHAQESLKSASLDGTQFEVSKDLDRLILIIRKSLDVRSLVKITVNDRPLAEAGRIGTISLFVGDFSRTFVLPDGKSAVIHAAIDYTDFIFKSFATLVLILVSITIGVRVLNKKLSASLNSITTPLDQLVDALDSKSVSEDSPLEIKLSDIQSGYHEVSVLAETLNKFLSRIKVLKIEEGRAEVADQVAHDVNSPLVALESILGDKSITLDENVRIHLRTSIHRIREIVGSLKGVVNKTNSSEHDESEKEILTEIDVVSLCSEIVNEKRLQYLDRPSIEVDIVIDREVYGLFAKADPSDFKRAISNLIDNAVDSIRNDGNVVIHFLGGESCLEVIVTDDGVGIPQDILEKLGRKGVTSKSAGHGLGFYSVKRSVESWGGKIFIESSHEKGTSVSLTLPKVRPPSWFLESLVIPDGGTVVVIDDDRSIHQTWQRVLATHTYNRNVRLEHYSSVSKFIKTLETEPTRWPPSTQFLVDYEFRGETETGLTAIDMLTQQKRSSVLVSSRFDDSKIILEIVKSDSRCLSKNMVPYVPVKIETNELESQVAL